MDYNNAVISIISVEDLNKIINELSLLKDEKIKLDVNNKTKIENYLCKKDNLYEKFFKLQFNTIKKLFNNEEDMKNFLLQNVSSIFTDHEMEAIYEKERKNLNDYVKNNFDPNKLAMQNFSFWLDENGDRHYSAEISEFNAQDLNISIEDLYPKQFCGFDDVVEFNEDESYDYDNNLDDVYNEFYNGIDCDTENLIYNKFIEENDINAEFTVDSITNYLKNNSENYNKPVDSNAVNDNFLSEDTNYLKEDSENEQKKDTE